MNLKNHRTRRLTSVLVASGALWSLTATASNAAKISDAASTWGTNGRVTAIVPVGDRVYIAGDFTAVVTPSGNTYPAANVAAYVPATGQFDLSWAGETDGPVNALAYQGGRLYLGGKFTTVDGARRGKLAALDATTGRVDAGWKPKSNRPVDSLAVAGGYVYAAGPISTITDTQGKHSVTYVARMDVSTGRWDGSWRPTPDARVRAVLPSADGTRVFVGGAFTVVDGQKNTRSVASLVAGSGAVDRTFRLGPINKSNRPPVLDMTTDGSHLLLAVAGGGGACTSVSPTTGQTQWSKHTNGNVQATAIVGGTAYCGGHFNGTAAFDGLTRHKVGAVNLATTQTLSFDPRVNSALGVWAMGSTSADLYLGGDFTKINGDPRPHFAAYPDIPF